MGSGEVRGGQPPETAGRPGSLPRPTVRPSRYGRLSVLGNTSDVNAGLLTRQVAEICLGDKLKPIPAKPPVAKKNEVEDDSALLDAYVGEYRVSLGMSVTVAKEGGKLTATTTGARKITLAAESDREFFVPGEDIGITFDAPKDGRCEAITAHVNGQHLPAKRFEKVTLNAKQAEEYVGEFYSAELGVIYTVFRSDARLTIRHPRGEVELRSVTGEEFEAARPLGKVTFTRESGRVTGFQIDTGRIQRLRFGRVEAKLPK